MLHRDWHRKFHRPFRDGERDVPPRVQIAEMRDEPEPWDAETMTRYLTAVDVLLEEHGLPLSRMCGDSPLPRHLRELRVALAARRAEITGDTGSMS